MGPPRPALKDILEGSLLRLKEAHQAEGVSDDDIAGLVSPAGKLVKGGKALSPDLIKGVMRGADGLGRRSGAKKTESEARTYGAGYDKVVLGVGMTLQRNRQTVTTLVDTPAGGILEAAIATEVRAKPGVLTLTVTEEAPGRILLEADAEFEGQLMAGGAGRRIVEDFFADLERYLRHLEPTWKALPPPAPQEWTAGTPPALPPAAPPLTLHGILSGGVPVPPQVPLAALRAWAAAPAGGTVQRLPPGGASQEAEATLDIGYAHGVLAVAWTLQRGGYALAALEDTGTGCAFAAQVPASLLAAGGAITAEVRHAERGLRVACTVGAQGQAVDAGLCAKLLRSLLADLDAAVWELAASPPPLANGWTEAT